MTFQALHISDLHIHSDKKSNDAVEKRIELIAEKFPEHKIIITGDITDDGSYPQWIEVERIFAPIASRCLICAGNHDYGYMGLAYQEEAARRFLYFSDELGVNLRSYRKIAFNIDVENNIMFIALDSNRHDSKYFGLPDFACGEIGEEQLAALNNLLAKTQYKDYKKILFFHHHPIYHTNPTMKLLDADKLISIIERKVDVMLFGHQHEMASWVNEIKRVRAYCAPALFETGLCWEIKSDGRRLAIHEIAIS